VVVCSSFAFAFARPRPQLQLQLQLLGAEGPAKNFDGPPRTLTKSQTHPPTIRLLFPLDFFLYVFGRFSAKGVQKHHKT
jgi:hypothetical protein